MMDINRLKYVIPIEKTFSFYYITNKSQSTFFICLPIPMIHTYINTYIHTYIHTYLLLIQIQTHRDTVNLKGTCIHRSYTYMHAYTNRQARIYLCIHYCAQNMWILLSLAKMTNA